MKILRFLAKPINRKCKFFGNDLILWWKLLRKRKIISYQVMLHFTCSEIFNVCNFEMTSKQMIHSSCIFLLARGMYKKIDMWLTMLRLNVPNINPQSPRLKGTCLYVYCGTVSYVYSPVSWATALILNCNVYKPVFICLGIIIYPF